MATNVAEGRRIDYTPGSAVSAGDVVTVGDLLGVSDRDIAAGKPGSLAVEGIYDFAKDTSTAFAAGVDVFWDATAKEATEDPAGGVNKYIGKTIQAAGATDATLRAKLAGGGAPGSDLGIQTIRQSVVIGDFTDDGAASGHVDLTTQLPKGALPLGVKYKVTTGFTGDTTAVVQAGVAGDLDRFSSVTDQSVLAAATVGHGVAADAADGMNAAQTIRITVTGGADFTSIAAGAMDISLAYLQM